MKTLLKLGIAVFGIFALGLTIAHYLSEMGESVFAPFALLAAIGACFCLLQFKSRYTNPPLEIRKLRYAYVLLLLVVLVDLFLFFGKFFKK